MTTENDNLNNMMIGGGKATPNGREAAPMEKTLDFSILPGGTHAVNVMSPSTERTKQSHAFSMTPPGTVTVDENGVRSEPAMKINSHGVSVMPGKILSTAKTMAGRTINSPSELTDTSIVKIAGIECTVGLAVAQGYLEKDGAGSITDPSAANWKAPEAQQPGKIQTQDFIDQGVRANLNGMEQMLGPQGLNIVMSSLIGAALSANNPDPQEHGKATRQAAEMAVDTAYSCSQASGKFIKAGDVASLAQDALKSAQKGLDSHCKKAGLDAQALMSHLGKCSIGFQRSFYIGILNQIGPNVVADLNQKMKLGNRP